MNQMLESMINDLNSELCKKIDKILERAVIENNCRDKEQGFLLLKKSYENRDLRIVYHEEYDIDGPIRFRSIYYKGKPVYLSSDQWLRSFEYGYWVSSFDQLYKQLNPERHAAVGCLG